MTQNRVIQTPTTESSGRTLAAAPSTSAPQEPRVQLAEVTFRAAVRSPGKSPTVTSWLKSKGDRCTSLHLTLLLGAPVVEAEHEKKTVHYPIGTVESFVILE